MKKIEFGKSKIINLIVCILAAATCIIYALADAKANSPLIIGMFAVAAIVEIVLCVKTIPGVEYIAFLCTLIGMAAFIKLAFDEIGDVLSKINMNGLSSSWIASAVLIVITVIAAGVSTIFVKENQKGQKEINACE